MVSVERIKQFINIPSEAPWRLTEFNPPPDWPTSGDIETKNLQVINQFSVHICMHDKLFFSSISCA